ncbi:MAG: penicillin acylase family protein [Anaerolineales bacterium]|nr:penicillin acylase family protein [Anaerolineales bacterium]
MSKILRAFITAFVIALTIVALIIGYLNLAWKPQTAQKSFPQTDGELQLAGLDGTVDIYRDRMGIPHIYASTLHDLFMAQGYVHAQDRFWQMDVWRHIGSGRLAEMFGAGQADTDAFLRTLGWRQIAEQEYEQLLSAEWKAILDAYAEGVNAYIQGRKPVELSMEYAILTGVLNRAYQIEPWTPIHTLTWAKAMAWDLRGNMDVEIERAILLKTLTQEQVDELFPPYPSDHPVIVPEIGEFGAASTQSSDHNVSVPREILALDYESLVTRLARLEPILPPGRTGIGSNSWTVDGTRSSTGKPLLANDPHLSIQMPSIWYQIDLHCAPKNDDCPIEVSGFSFAGTPGVIIGHNDRVAWGFTNVGPDVMDLYILKINPQNPNQYEYNGKWLDFDTRDETIHIAGGETLPLTVRISRFGPVISEVYGALKDKVEPKSDATPFKDQAGIELPSPYAIALRWTALEPGPVFEAIWGFNKAQNWEEFRAAARNFIVPAQNLLYADVDGNIGYQMPGNIPIRKNGDGRLPVPGWTDEYEWQGYIPFEELPYVLNPPSGYIVTANNQVPPKDFPYTVSTDWDYGFRAQRIVEMIEQAPGKIDIAYFQKMQGDNKNLNAETLVPALAALNTHFATPNQAIAIDILNHWDYQNTMDSQAAAIFEWYWWNLLMDVFKDDLPENYWPAGGSRWFEVMRSLIQKPDSPWWDDKATAEVVETRDDMLPRAFTETIQQLEKEYGKDPNKWPRWGDLHAAVFRNSTLGRSGIAPIENLFNRGPFPTGGGDSIVNATGWDVGESFETNWLPSMRMIVDLSNLNNSLTVHTTGQSGHADHPHYIDMADLWRNIQYYPMLWDTQQIIREAEAHLLLIP